jgi:Zn-dependent protease with chaperone function
MANRKRSISRNQALAASLLTLAATVHAQSPGRVSSRVLAYFDNLSKEHDLDEYLILGRPTPVSLRYKAAALANLPLNSNVQLSARSQAKLAALAPILEFYERSGIIEPQVIADTETTFIGLYERSALLITQQALGLFSKEELQAIVAHELAHEWYWDEYRLARESNQDDKVQEIELRCDGIAILALGRMRLSPSQLISALQKMGQYDADTLGANHYAAPDERLTFARSMIKWTSTSPRVR